MNRSAILLIIILAASSAKADYLLGSIGENLSIEFAGETQEGLTQQRFELLQLKYINSSNIQSPTYGFYIIHYQGKSWGPQIIEHVQGHSPLIIRKGNIISLFYVSGANTHVLQTWEFFPQQSKFSKVSEESISSGSRPNA